MQRAHKAGTGSASKVSFLPTARARLGTLFPRAPDDYVDMWTELQNCIGGFPAMNGAQLDRIYKQMVCHAWYGIESHFGGDTWDFEAWYEPGDWSSALNPTSLCQNYPLVDGAAAEFVGQIVQTTADDNAGQKRAWLVEKAGGGYIRRHIPTSEIYYCLTRGGAHVAGPLPEAFLTTFLGGIGADIPQTACGAPASHAAPALAVTGSCTSSGGTLTGTSSGFTAGGTATIRAWYPDGREYTNLIHSSGVRSDGSIGWTWPCQGDPAGTYTTEAVDDATGASTGRVAFTIGAPQGSAEPPPPPDTIQVTVYNKVTNDATTMREDTPAYLSTVTKNYCKRDGCALGGTDVGTGAVITAYCQTSGDRTTNGWDGNSIDDGNPGLYESTRWYGIRWVDGRTGYLSEVWIDPSQHGGLGLRAC